MDLTIHNLVWVPKVLLSFAVAGNFGVGRRPKRRENKDLMETENCASLVSRVLSTMDLSNFAKFRKKHNEE